MVISSLTNSARGLPAKVSVDLLVHNFPVEHKTVEFAEGKRHFLTLCWHTAYYRHYEVYYPVVEIECLSYKRRETPLETNENIIPEQNMYC